MNKAESGKRKAEGRRKAGSGVRLEGRGEFFAPVKSRFSISRFPLSAFRSGSRFGSRSGVSLLEVLISTFALSVGLLSLAALIPAGQVTMLEAIKADRSAACGRAGLCEVKIRRMLEPYQTDLDDPTAEVQMWVRVVDKSLTYNDNTTANMFDVNASKPDERPGPVFCIDPWGIAKAAKEMDLDDSPDSDYNVLAMQTFPALAPADQNDPDTVWMPRVSLRAAASTGFGPLNLAQAERIFKWRDDLVFTYRDDVDRAEVDNDAMPSTLELPDTTMPSTGTFSPGRTRTRSPARMSSMATSTSRSPSRRTAVRAPSPTSDATAPLARALARASIQRPVRMRPMIMAEESK